MPFNVQEMSFSYTHFQKISLPLSHPPPSRSLLGHKFELKKPPRKERNETNLSEELELPKSLIVNV